MADQLLGDDAQPFLPLLLFLQFPGDPKYGDPATSQQTWSMATYHADLVELTGRCAGSQVVGQLRAKLADTTKGFQEVMTVRQDNLKAHQGRRQLFSALPDSVSARSRQGTPAQLSACAVWLMQRRFGLDSLPQCSFKVEGG